MAKQEKNVYEKRPPGRPRGTQFATAIPVRLRPETVENVDELARKRDEGRSETIRFLIESALKRGK